MKNDEKYMRLALNLAKKGEGKVSPNPMVGAVVVKDGKVVGKGFHEEVGRAHAEINALVDAGKKAIGADLFLNLEPCSSYGKTPPCASAIIKSGVRRVVTSMVDPNTINSFKGIKVLRESGIDVEVGVLENEAKRLNEVFIKYITTGIPFVTVKCAMSLDGKIATRTGESKWISNEKSRTYVHYMRSVNDAIMIGINTVLKDDPLLTNRLSQKRRKDPIKIILDPNLKINLRSRMLREESSATTVIVKNEKRDDLNKAGELEKLGVKVVSVKCMKDGKIDIKQLLELISKMGISSVLIEGGGELIASCVNLDVVDKFMFFVAPKLIGGSNAKTPVEGAGIEKIEEALELTDIRVELIENDVLIEAYRRRDMVR